MIKGKKTIINYILSICCLILIGLLVYIANESHYIDRLKLKIGMIDYIENNDDFYALQAWESSLESIDEDVDIVFFGDSMTRKGEWQKYFPDIKVCNLGYSGDIIHGLINRESMVDTVSPKKVFITCGINNMMKNNYEDTLDKGYNELLDELINKKHYKVYIQSILPVRKPNKIDNEDIIHENERIKKIADKYGATYIDLHTSFVDNEGNLSEKYSLDGTHVNKEGYKVWKDVISKYIYE